MVKFTAAGYVCVDYYPDFNDRCYTTGNGVDVLFNLLAVRDDLDASIVSAISDDAYGKMCLEAFHSRKIDCSHLEIIPGGQTPRVPLRLVDNDRVHGQPIRGIMKDYVFSDEAVDFICKHDVMHSDFTGRLIPRLPEIKRRGVKVFFDLGNQPDHPHTRMVLEGIFCGLVSFEQDGEQARDFLKYAHSLGPELMLATFGENGSLAYDGNRFYRGDIVPVEHVVNTVGAGDSYFAGFISAWLDGRPMAECMEQGAVWSAQVISVFDPYL